MTVMAKVELSGDSVLCERREEVGVEGGGRLGASVMNFDGEKLPPIQPPPFHSGGECSGQEGVIFLL